MLPLRLRVELKEHIIATLCTQWCVQLNRAQMRLMYTHACAHVAVATCNFEILAAASELFLPPHSPYSTEDGKGKSGELDCIGCESRERSSERQTFWPPSDHLNCPRAAAIYCPSVILPARSASLSLPLSSSLFGHSHQGHLGLQHYTFIVPLFMHTFRRRILHLSSLESLTSISIFCR